MALFLLEVLERCPTNYLELTKFTNLLCLYVFRDGVKVRKQYKKYETLFQVSEKLKLFSIKITKKTRPLLDWFKDWTTRQFPLTQDLGKMESVKK